MYGVLHDMRVWGSYLIDCGRWLLRHRHGPLAQRSFRFKDVPYSYLVHPYNHTWDNERAVEVPIINRLIAGLDPAAILEVGNVLSHYGPTRHTVLDKYENRLSSRIRHEDILTTTLERQFQLIVSISTIEHVGWDESPRHPEQVLQVFPKLRKLLAPGGRAVLTIPLGYNNFLDESLRKKEIDVSELLCLRRVTAGNDWEEAPFKDVSRTAYDSPFPSANAVAFLVLGSPLEAD